MYAETGLLFPYFHNFSQEAQQLDEYCKTQKCNASMVLPISLYFGFKHFVGLIDLCRGPFFQSTADQIRKFKNSLKAQSPSDSVVHSNKNIKRNGFQPSIRPKPKKKPSPFKSQIHVCQSNISRFKNISEKKRESSHVKAPFSLLFWCGAQGK